MRLLTRQRLSFSVRGEGGGYKKTSPFGGRSFSKMPRARYHFDISVFIMSPTLSTCVMPLLVWCGRVTNVVWDGGAGGGGAVGNLHLKKKNDLRRGAKARLARHAGVLDDSRDPGADTVGFDEDHAAGEGPQRPC